MVETMESLHAYLLGLLLLTAQYFNCNKGFEDKKTS